jgi:hypothetical protein
MGETSLVCGRNDLWAKLYVMTLPMSTAIVDFHKGRNEHKKNIFTKRAKIYSYLQEIYKRKLTWCDPVVY